MKTPLVLVSLLLFTSAAHAQKIVVRKVKGNQAVVQFTGTPLTTGQKYDLEGFEDAGGSSSGGGGPRKTFIGVSASLTSLKTETETANFNSTNWSVSGYYGWNYGTYEIGPVASFSSQDSGGGATTAWKVGGRADWNLIPNRSGNDMIYGAGFLGTYGNTSYPNGGGSGNTMEFYPAGFLKWFILKTPTCFRIDGGYQYSETTISNVKTKSSGFAFAGGFFIYF